MSRFFDSINSEIRFVTANWCCWLYAVEIFHLSVLFFNTEKSSKSLCKLLLISSILNYSGFLTHLDETFSVRISINADYNRMFFEWFMKAELDLRL